MKTPRLRRLFGEDGRCLNVALDHGLFNEPSFIPGLERIDTVVSQLAEANPDAIQLTNGTAHWLQEIPGRNRPALVFRTDVANIYGDPFPAFLFSVAPEQVVQQAVEWDAAAVVVNLLWAEGQDSLYHQSLVNTQQMIAASRSVGMPVMVEPLVLRANQGKYGVEGNPERIAGLVRQAVELGADVIKADPTAPPERFTEVVQVAGSIPVLARGGSRVGLEELLRRTAALMACGARGIVYGRNIAQDERPVAMTRALMALIHEGVSIDRALAVYREVSRK